MDIHFPWTNLPVMFHWWSVVNICLWLLSMFNLISKECVYFWLLLWINKGTLPPGWQKCVIHAWSTHRPYLVQHFPIIHSVRGQMYPFLLRGYLTSSMTIIRLSPCRKTLKNGLMGIVWMCEYWCRYVWPSWRWPTSQSCMESCVRQSLLRVANPIEWGTDSTLI